MQQVEEFVKQLTGVDNLSKNTRQSNYVFARYCFCMIASKCLGVTYEKIGQYIGKDHSAVSHLINHYKWPIEKQGIVSRIMQYCSRGFDMEKIYDIESLIHEIEELSSRLREAEGVLQDSQYGAYINKLREMDKEYRDRCLKQIDINYEIWKRQQA